jgi:lipopolysaccharide/colanic/teichoic acid biosynthesis glycosyltransferase
MIDIKAQVHTLSQATLPKRELDAALGSAYLLVEDRPFYAALKRMLDLLVSAIALLVLSPIMVIIGVAIRLDSRGPALFAQQRVGQGGKEFTLYKFRSMYQDADDQVHRAFAKQYIHGRGNADQAGCFKPKDDPRVTPVGRILRKTSLDELPQLWNVFKGEMSLVGPRPAVRYEVEEYERWQMRRLAVVPGLTGLAQVHGRSALPFNQLVRCDIQYVEERDIWLDAEILLKTIPVVLSAKSAN